MTPATQSNSTPARDSKINKIFGRSSRDSNRSADQGSPTPRPPPSRPDDHPGPSSSPLDSSSSERTASSSSFRRPPRASLDRPASMMVTHNPDIHPPPFNSRLSDFPSRLSGWFSAGSSNGSTMDLNSPTYGYPADPSSSQSQSPKHKASILFNNAARHGKGGLEKAVRYLFDPEAQPDKSSDSIWVMGVEHPALDVDVLTSSSLSSQSIPAPAQGHRRDFTESSLSTKKLSPSNLPKMTHSNTSVQSLSSTLHASSSNTPAKQTRAWPPSFLDDFSTCLWMTYRSQYIAIRDNSLAELERDAMKPQDLQLISSSPPKQKWWPLGGEKVWHSDTGWGCMLRTGQNVLASALVHLYLGRDWRRPALPTSTPDYAQYVQIISWFLDSPSALSPFSIHRMALAGKELGKDVGCWFGPSTAAGAIKTLVHAFPESRLSVAIAVDGALYESDVYAASNSHQSNSSKQKQWGDYSVLVLLGVRLGIDGVNPIYYESIRSIFTWPQSVGIAGGRPSSSYYFIGEQAGSLFYLDPHHTRPSVPLKYPPPAAVSPSSRATSRSDSSDFDDSAPEKTSLPAEDRSHSPENKLRHSSRHSAGGSSKSGRSVTKPSFSGPPEQNQVSIAPSINREDIIPLVHRPTTPPQVIQHYTQAYPLHELRSFHCEKIRKMPMSSLDPSMLLGFLCKTEGDWIDLRRRVTELSKTHKAIFTILDEQPAWLSDPEDLESMSEPEHTSDDSFDSPVGDVDGDEESDSPSNFQLVDANSPNGIPSSLDSNVDIPNPHHSSGPAEERSSRHSTLSAATTSSRPDSEDEDDDWVDSVFPPSEAASSPSSSYRHRQSEAGTSDYKLVSPANLPFPQTHLPTSDGDVQITNPLVNQFPGMRSMTARDGGRTASGGVKALAEPTPGVKSTKTHK